MKKNIYAVMLVLMLPLAALAQDTAYIRQQAQMLGDAVVRGDYKVVVDHTYQGVIDMAGGKDKMLSSTTDAMNNMKSQGYTIETLVAGHAGDFYKAGTQIHCLLPETLHMKSPTGHVLVKSFILAVSDDQGKTWTFMDVNANTKNLLPQLFPNFNPDLKIPDPGPPVVEQ